MTAIEGLTCVGDGEFCASCFGALLGASADDSASTATSGAVRGPAAELRATGPSATEPHATEPPARRSRALVPRRTCLVCDRDLGGVPAVVFLGGELCGPCSAEMAAELDAATQAPAPAAAAATSATAAAAPAAGAGSALTPPSAEEAPTFTPGSGTARCAGCERPMPGPGSYRLLHGQPYCPACLPFYARLAPAAHGPAVPAAASGLAEAPSACDCCRRALDAAAQVRAGFNLCSACLSSDANLALSVARARHRRELARLRSTLEGDS